MKYIDSSAFVKCYCDEDAEKGAQKVADLLEDVMRSKEKLISSIILIGEVVSAFDKRLRRKILTREQFDESTGQFASDIQKLSESGSIVFEEITLINITSAVDFIVKYHLPVNDALHLYTALANSDKISEFVSSDKSLNAAAIAEGLKVLNPEE